MKEILIIMLCVPLFVINSFCDKLASNSDGTKYNTFKFIIGSFILFPLFIFDKLPHFNLGTIFCGIACGFMYAINKIVILKGYKKTSVSFMTLCHAAGMLAPCILGHFLWNERINAISLIGILLTAVSIVVMKSSGNKKDKISVADLLIGVVVFASSGGVMILQKIMGIYFKNESVSAYNFYSFVVPAIVMLLFFAKNKHSKKTDKNNKIILYAFGSSVSLCVISLVMTKMAGSVPSAVMFPLFNGTGIIAVCIGAIFAFNEKMTIRQIGAMCTSVIGMCLASI